MQQTLLLWSRLICLEQLGVDWGRNLTWIYAVFVFRPFLFLRKKACNFSSAFLYVHIRINQTVDRRSQAPWAPPQSKLH